MQILEFQIYPMDSVSRSAGLFELLCDYFRIPKVRFLDTGHPSQFIDIEHSNQCQMSSFFGYWIFISRPAVLFRILFDYFRMSNFLYIGHSSHCPMSPFCVFLFGILAFFSNVQCLKFGYLTFFQAIVQ